MRPHASIVTSIAIAALAAILMLSNAAAQTTDFALKSRPDKGTVLRGGNTVFTVITVGASGFSGTVGLSLAGLPAGATASFAPASTTGAWGASLLTVSTAGTTPVGTFPLTITATSGTLVRRSAVQLEVRAGHTFTHPGILLNSTQLARMTLNVAGGQSPWQSAFLRARNHSLGAATYTPSPQVSVDTGNTVQTQAVIADSQAAYTQALLWRITQNPVHAQNAIEIMDAWASTFRGGFSGSNYMNVAAWTGDNWPRAAEIIRYTYLSEDGTSRWPAASIQAFKDFLAFYYVPLVTAGRPFGYYGGNLNSSSAAASINIGVFNDDAQTFFRGLWLWRYTLPAYIYMSGDGPIPAPPANWPAAKSTSANLGTLWYQQNPLVNGLSQETCRDLGHVQWGLAALANGAETAYVQGVDLLAESTLGSSNAARLQAGLEFNATYLNRAPTPAWLCSGVISLGKSVATGELAYNHLVNRSGLSLPQLSGYLSANRPTGASYFMNWETLTHFGNP